MIGGVSVAAALLDTCAVIWLANGDAMAETAVEAIDVAARATGVLVSAISAWEVGLLSRPGRTREPTLTFLPDAGTWFRRVMTGPGIRAAPFTPQIAIEASRLPGVLHSDPADRLLISTARNLDVPIITRDRRIIEYGQTGYVRVIAC